MVAGNENNNKEQMKFPLSNLWFIYAFQVHGRCKKNNISGSKHYLTVASGVMMSVFVSPVIAAVTVGKEQTTTWPPSVSVTEKSNQRRKEETR